VRHNYRIPERHALAATQPGLKSGGLQSVVSNAREGLQGRIKDVDELRSRILTDCDELDQRVIMIRQSGSGAHIFVRVLKGKADTLNTN